MSTGVSYLAIIMLMIRLVFPLCPAGTFQAEGAATIDGTPIAYELNFDTQEQTLGLTLKSLSTGLYKLAADQNRIIVSGENGSERYTAAQLAHDMEGLLPNGAMDAIPWEKLGEYFAQEEYAEDLQAVFYWLKSAHLSLPEPELMVEDGEAYYQLCLNAPQLLSIVLDAAVSLSVPSREYDALRSLHIWDVLDMEPETNLRVMSGWIDQLIHEGPYLYEDLIGSSFLLVIQWTDACDRYSGMPDIIRTEISFIEDEEKYAVTMQMDRNGLSGTMHVNNRQIAGMLLTGQENKIVLNVGLELSETEYYKFTAAYSTECPYVQAELKSYTIADGERWDDVSLLSLRVVDDEMLFTLQDFADHVLMQGAVYWTDAQCCVNLRAREMTSYSQGELIEFHMQNTRADDGVMIADWDFALFDDDLSMDTQGEGTLQYAWTPFVLTEETVVE